MVDVVSSSLLQTETMSQPVGPSGALFEHVNETQLLVQTQIQSLAGSSVRGGAFLGCSLRFPHAVVLFQCYFNAVGDGCRAMGSETCNPTGTHAPLSTPALDSCLFFVWPPPR